MNDCACRRILRLSAACFVLSMSCRSAPELHPREYRAGCRSECDILPVEYSTLHVGTKSTDCDVIYTKTSHGCTFTVDNSLRGDGGLITHSYVKDVATFGEIKAFCGVTTPCTGDANEQVPPAKARLPPEGLTSPEIRNAICDVDCAMPRDGERWLSVHNGPDACIVLSQESVHGCSVDTQALNTYSRASAPEHSFIACGGTETICGLQVSCGCNSK